MLLNAVILTLPEEEFEGLPQGGFGSIISNRRIQRVVSSVLHNLIVCDLRIMVRNFFKVSYKLLKNYCNVSIIIRRFCCLVEVIIASLTISALGNLIPKHL